MVDWTVWKIPSLDLLSRILPLFTLGRGVLLSVADFTELGSFTGLLKLILDRSQSLSIFFGTVTDTSRAIAPRVLSPLISLFTTFSLSPSTPGSLGTVFLSMPPMLLECSKPPSQPSSWDTTCTNEALKFRFLMLDGLITSCVLACLSRGDSLVSLWPKGRRKAGWMKCSGIGLAGGFATGLCRATRGGSVVERAHLTVRPGQIGRAHV